MRRRPRGSGTILNRGSRLVVPSLRGGARVDTRTPSRWIRRVLRDLGLYREGMGWYEATRHTFSAHWAMSGRSLRELQAILGHSSLATTERYAHFMPDHFAAGVHGALSVSLQSGTIKQLEVSREMKI